METNFRAVPLLSQKTSDLGWSRPEISATSTPRGQDMCVLCAACPNTSYTN